MPRPQACATAAATSSVIRNTRGSSFSMCRRARDDDRYPKYPRLPVTRCPGFEPREEGVAREGTGARGGDVA